MASLLHMDSHVPSYEDTSPNKYGFTHVTPVTIITSSDALSSSTVILGVVACDANLGGALSTEHRKGQKAFHHRPGEVKDYFLKQICPFHLGKARRHPEERENCYFKEWQENSFAIF